LDVCGSARLPRIEASRNSSSSRRQRPRATLEGDSGRLRERTSQERARVRVRLIEEALRFTRAAAGVRGVLRISLLGSILSAHADPKDVDLLVQVAADADLAALAACGRRLQGRAQAFNRGADVFLSDESGRYLGRTCHWRDCRPGIRASCDALNCGRHCGYPVTGEAVTKKETNKVYVYYRCSRYNVAGHPWDRVTEAKFDAQVAGWLSRMKLPEAVWAWFVRTLRQWHQHAQKDHRDHADALQRELSSLRNQQDRNHNLYNLGEIELDTFSKKNSEYLDRIAACDLQLQAVDRRREEHAELPEKVFELSQSLAERWLNADYAAKRRILEIDGATLVPEMRKPFDVLVEGLSVFSSRGDKI
jgi:hypothetical protein